MSGNSLYALSVSTNTNDVVGFEIADQSQVEKRIFAHFLSETLIPPTSLPSSESDQVLTKFWYSFVENTNRNKTNILIYMRVTKQDSYRIGGLTQIVSEVDFFLICL